MSNQETEATQTSEQAPNLSLQDLLLIAQTIQVVASRGAFRAEEMSNIGGMYNRLIAFLNATGAIKPAEQPQENTESSPGDQK